MSRIISVLTHREKLLIIKRVDLATGAQVILDAAGTCHPTNLVSGKSIHP